MAQPDRPPALGRNFSLPRNAGSGAGRSRYTSYRVWTEGGYCNCRTWVEWFKEVGPAAEPAPALSATPNGPVEGSPAPDFALTDNAGDPIRLADLKERVVALDFWGVDCRACLNMMDRLRPEFASLDTSRLAVLAVNIDADRSLYEQFLKQKGSLGFRMLYDDSGVARSYGIRGLPHFVIIDQDGVVRANVKGSTEQHVSEIRTEVGSLLGPRPSR
jgi:peroxiredoxin